MDGQFPVLLGGRTVGKVQLERQGLYYRVVCRCSLSGEVMYRLEASGVRGKAGLGILVPMESGFGLETRFPVSRVGEEALRFTLTPRHDDLCGRKFVPIRAEEPFAYISRLKDAFLEQRNGQTGASIPENDEKREACGEK